jgi:hypothetical protein
MEFDNPEMDYCNRLMENNIPAMDYLNPYTENGIPEMINPKNKLFSVFL